MKFKKSKLNINILLIFNQIHNRIKINKIIREDNKRKNKINKLVKFNNNKLIKKQNNLTIIFNNKALAGSLMIFKNVAINNNNQV